MTAQVIPLSTPKNSNLRPFDMRRDLSAVADLVELCFADTLDADGRLYIRQMREAAISEGFSYLSTNAGRSAMGGYVWVEDGQVVGNLSLVPHTYEGRRIHLIANVAVHPNSRRRGIARELTAAALRELDQRGSRETWLQVDEKNNAAVLLYQNMGFVEKTRRVSWRLLPHREFRDVANGDVVAAPRRAGDWSLQSQWLHANYPADIRWQLPMNVSLLQPGWRGALERAFNEREVQQWSALRKNRLLGVLTWQSSTLETDRLWLAAPAEHEDAAIPVLAGIAHAQLRPNRTLALNYPQGRGQSALESAGFHAARTLIWMSYPMDGVK
jgi:GNAT superfamily N-acetyltransferase